MREAGRIDNELDARTFRDVLFARGIEAEVESTRDGTWAVWVLDDDRLEEAEELVAAFRADPADPRFTGAADEGEAARRAREAEERAFAKKMKTREDIFQTYGFAGMGKVTLVLIAASVVVTLLIRLGANTELVSRLSVAAISTGPGGAGFYRTDLAEVRAGEVWRLVTPIFMHFSLLHILFNMMWLRDLGSMIEGRRGAVFLLGFVAAVGALSNLAQFYVAGPLFGGMSGVVYGLLGYVWMQSRFNPWSGFVLHPTTVRMMLIWFVICLTGLVGPIANMAHAGGLVAGVVWGYADARRRVPE